MAEGIVVLVVGKSGLDEKVGVQKGTSRSTKMVKNVRRFKRWKMNEGEESECRLTE
jgi:hypothetical protein